jgi:hypothetical protein
MLSPKDIYPVDWFKEYEQRAKTIIGKEVKWRSSPQYSTRRLSSGCLLIQLGLTPVTGCHSGNLHTVPPVEVHNAPR